MSEQFESASGAWEQVLQSRPSLKPHVRIYAHTYRDRDWYLLVDPLTNNQLLVDRPAYHFLNLLTDHQTVQDARDRLDDQLGIKLEAEDIAPLFATLTDAEMLHGEMRPSPEELYERRVKSSERKRLQRLFRPLAIQLPLVDPDNFLNALLPVARLAFSRWGFACFLLLVLVAGSICLGQWQALGVHWESRFLDPTNLLWLWLLYPLVKGVHEIGHGLAAKLWGAEIHQMGIMLLVFMPVPFVDASSTGSFFSARHRMIVAAAGILTEVLLASIAVIGWSNAESGFIKDMLCNVAVIGGGSTILFNGNPLLRFDGYYVLSDAIEIPNLGTRASRYLGYLLKKYPLGLDCPTPFTARGEIPWLVGYGIASGLYRLFISFTIALYVASQFFVVGMMLAAWFVFYQILRPLALMVVRLIPLAIGQGRVLRVAGVLSVVAILVPTLMFGVPIRHSTVAYGIIVPPENSQLRVMTSGFITKANRQNGDWVNPGDVLFELRDDELTYRERDLVGRYDELQAQLGTVFLVDRSEAARLKEEIETLQLELTEVHAQIAGLTVTSSLSGAFSSAHSTRALGRFVRKGDVLGLITRSDDWTLRVMIPQESIDLVRRKTVSINAISQSDPYHVIEAAWESEIPLATSQLPSRTLGTPAGGQMPVDARDQEGLRLITPMFQVQVRLPGALRDYYIGQTFVVRFLHHAEPVGIRLYKWLRRLLLTYLQL